MIRTTLPYYYLYSPHILQNGLVQQVKSTSTWIPFSLLPNFLGPTQVSTNRYIHPNISNPSKFPAIMFLFRGPQPSPLNSLRLRLPLSQTYNVITNPRSPRVILHHQWNSSLPALSRVKKI